MAHQHHDLGHIKWLAAQPVMRRARQLRKERRSKAQEPTQFFLDWVANKVYLDKTTFRYRYRPEYRTSR